ncbi:hypothetical protein [Pedobacter nutrimenti]|uniref:hypothetical protein n=1 Tax=Pedobacter nutrimenti TaxID=1241337 RepID=UPI00292EB3E6|nr:hypothetical protein [Pedobacter nutrimenti]
MKKEEADKMAAKYRHLVYYLHYDTINQILMDLYIDFQDNSDDAYEDRMEYKKEISAVISPFISTTIEDGVNYEVVSNAKIWIDTEVFIVESLTRIGKVLSIAEFYRPGKFPECIQEKRYLLEG